jgi:hypothetical protein
MRALVAALLLLSLSLAAVETRADSSATHLNDEVFISIEGTVWSGFDSLGKTCTFRYLKGGVLNYTTPSGTFQNGTWKQRETNVYMEMNGKYAEYRGVLEGDHIIGQAGNIKGLHWSWRVERTKTVEK